MKLSEALKIVLGSGEICVLDCSVELHDARRLVLGYIEHLIKRGEEVA